MKIDSKKEKAYFRMIEAEERKEKRLRMKPYYDQLWHELKELEYEKWRIAENYEEQIILIKQAIKAMDDIESEKSNRELINQIHAIENNGEDFTYDDLKEIFREWHKANYATSDFSQDLRNHKRYLDEMKENIYGEFKPRKATKLYQVLEMVYWRCQVYENAAIGYHLIMNECGISNKTVTEYMKYLVDNKYIEVTQEAQVTILHGKKIGKGHCRKYKWLY